MYEPLSTFAQDIYRAKRYDFDGTEEWPDTARRVATFVLGALGYDASSEEVYAAEQVIRKRLFIPGGRYLYAAGRDLHQTNNCLLLRADDTREGWSDTYWKANTALMTGAGIGVDYSDLRGRNSYLRRTGGIASGPLPHIRSVNELGRAAVQGGSRRAAIWAGLNWQHPDIFEFIEAKDWDDELRELKLRRPAFPMELEFTNVSVQLDDAFFTAYDAGDAHAHAVYDQALAHMLKHGEPGFSIDVGANAGETLRNACTEITSADDSDICNLGSLNLGRIETLQEFNETQKIATLFLLAGTVYSDVPYPKVAQVREKNRRLGLGLMGVHEWLLKRDYSFDPNPELERWLYHYSLTGGYANEYADDHSLSRPVKTRAIAPNGTISLLGETTSAGEPVFCTAYARGYYDHGGWRQEYIVDPTAARLIEQGIAPDDIEDAYVLAEHPERRFAFQAWLQQYVDHGISSTVNLPAPITDPDAAKDFGSILYSHLPKLRGVTCYPDGARSGQPLQKVDYAEVVESQMLLGTEEVCVSGACGV